MDGQKEVAGWKRCVEEPLAREGTGSTQVSDAMTQESGEQSLALSRPPAMSASEKTTKKTRGKAKETQVYHKATVNHTEWTRANLVAVSAENSACAGSALVQLPV